MTNCPSLSHVLRVVSVMLLLWVARASAAEQGEIALGADCWQNPSGWSLLEGGAGNGAATLVGGDHRMTVSGAVARPLAVGLLHRASLRGELRFRVPDRAPDWSSVSLALYEPGEGRASVRDGGV